MMMVVWWSCEKEGGTARAACVSFCVLCLMVTTRYIRRRDHLLSRVLLLLLLVGLFSLTSYM